MSPKTCAVITTAWGLDVKTEQRIVSTHLLSGLVALALAAFSVGSSGSDRGMSESAHEDVAFGGAGVKGPMSGATVRFYQIDTNQPLMYDANRPVGFTMTRVDGTFKRIRLDRSAKPPFVIVVDGSAAIDIHTGRTPVIPELITVVTAEDFAAARPVYATPLTTLAIMTTRETLPRGVSIDAAMAAINTAAAQTRNIFGFGLISGTNILRDPVVLNDSTTTPEAQHAVAKHRAAVEAASAVIFAMAQRGVSNATLVSETAAETIMTTLARDVARDGVADGRDGTTTLSDVDTTLLASNPATLMVPDTNITIANIGDILQAEATLQQVNIEVFADSLVITDGTTTTSDPTSTSTTSTSSTTSTTLFVTTTTTTTASTTTTTAPTTTTTTTASSTTTTSTAPSTTTTTVANALGATYYVDRNNALANDANTGTTTQPFLTISRAAQVARAGDTVIVMSGVYPESVNIANSGTVTQPITFTANGDVVVDSPTTDSWSGVFNVVGKTDIVISGFTVKNAYYGIKIDKDRAGIPSERITVKNNYATLSKSSGIRVAFSRNVTVDANVVEKTNWGGVHEMISIIDTDGFLVKNNEVFNGTFVMNDVVMEGKEGIDAKDGSRNGRIINNKVHDLTRLGIYLDAWDALTHTIEVSGNIVYNCKQGIALSSESGGLLQNVLVSNNITYNNRAYGIIVPIWVANGPRENIRIANNTVYGNASGGINIGTTNAYLIEIQNNIVANNGGAALNAANVGVITISSNNLVVGRNVGNILFGTITGEPRFVDAAAGNFQLNAGSAAIDQGISHTEVRQDIVGTPRPLGGAHDIGAYESR